MAYEIDQIIREPWGRIQVVIDGEDVTYFRGVPVQIGSWSNAEPFGDVRMDLSFPQISSIDSMGGGTALPWLKEFANIEVYRVRPDETVDRDKPLFEGMVVSFTDSSSDESTGLTLECQGALWQLDFYVRAPRFITKPIYHEYHIRGQFDHGIRPHLRTKELEIEYPHWWGTEQDPNKDKHQKSEGSVHGDNVNMLAEAGIIQGYDENTYGPGDAMLRGQMATILANTIDWLDNNTVDQSDPPASTTNHFTDDDGTVHEPNINRLADHNITEGVTATTYEPNNPVLRKHAASFWDRALTYMGKPLPPESADHFPDDTGLVQQGAINRLYEAGILVGYPDGTYRPNDALTRAQAATLAIRVIRYITGGYLPSGFDEFGDIQGRRVTGEQTKWTGDWGKALTTFVQELLADMQHDDDGVNNSFKWTMHHDPGRQPVIRMKDVTTVHWTISTGAPGVTTDMTHDWSVTANTFYGEGTDRAGTKWRNAYIRPGGGMTNYRPLAVDPKVTRVLNNTLHTTNEPNPAFDQTAVRIETYQSYVGGVTLDQATKIAERQLAKDKEPGWFGTITLRVDPEEGSRFEIRAGQNILLKYFKGTSVTGMLFHIAQVEVDITSYTVTLTVDSKARDLLALDELMERRDRDNKTPARLLRQGRESAEVADTRTPWDVQAGAGMIPAASKDMQLQNILTTTVGYRPADNEAFYKRVKAGAPTARERWAFVPVYVQEYGSIQKAEMTLYDAAGNVRALPFHWALYGNWFGGSMSVDYMPSSVDAATGATVYDPFLEGVFDNPENLDDSRVIMWGSIGQRAGYWPGIESNGDPVTGRFVDEGNFEYTLDEGNSTMWVAIYVDNTPAAGGNGQDVFIQGRLHKGSE